MRYKSICIAIFILSIYLIDGFTNQTLAMQNSQAQLTEKVFISIFHDAEKNMPPGGNKHNIILSDQAAAYIESCCHDRESVKRLLVENGFKTTEPIDTEKKEESQQYWMSRGYPKYDYAIFAKRGPGILRFWKIFTIYEANIYFKDGKVEWVFARSDTTYP